MKRLLLAAVLSLAGLSAFAQTKVHWYGQAAFRIETPSGGVLLIDPWLKVPTNPDKASVEKLGRVDYILVTHGHWDHIGDAVEIGKKTGATLATGGNVGGTFNLEKIGVKVSVVPAVHGSELVPPMVKEALAAGNPVGYVIKIDNGPTIYHTGDTDVFGDMRLIGDFHEIDLMLCVIGGHFTMDPVRAAQAVEWVKPKEVTPMHFGTYPILAGTPAQFKAALEKRGVKANVVEMKPGETRTLK